VLTGTQLEATLLPAGALPSGYAIDPSGERNSGDGTPADASQPVSASKACSLLTGSSWVLAGGISSGSFAQNDYVNAAKTAEVAQEVDSFTGNDAQQAMAALWQAFGECAKFSDASQGASAAITMVSSRLPGVGDEAFDGVQKSPSYNGGTTLVAIRVGSSIVTVLYSSPGNDDGHAAIGYAEAIASKVKAAE
jgi:hypothetical protein